MIRELLCPVSGAITVITRVLYHVVEAIALREWPGKCLGYESTTAEGVEIIGTESFIVQTKRALCLIRMTSFLSDVVKYIGVIKEFKRSGMQMYSRKPTFEVGARTWRNSVVWYAGAIVHDACHSKLYFEEKLKRWLFVPYAAWGGVEAEKKCISYQIGFLEELREKVCSNGSFSDSLLTERVICRFVDYLKRLRENPTYLGKATWAEYKKRDW